MKSLLVVSYARDRLATTDAASRAEALTCLGDDARVLHTDDGWIAFDGEDPGDRVDHTGASFTLRLGRAARTRTGDVTTAELAEQLGKGTKADGVALAELVPPFAAAHRSGPGEPTVAATDWLGFRQLFWWQGDGVAAISTSALALGALAGAGLDHGALGLQSLVGWQVGLGTVFAQVEKVPAGCLAVLDAGRVETHRYVEQSLALDGPAPSLPEAVDEMAGMLREFLRAYIADHPTTVLQLTGGQDTRVLLAALSPETRRGLRALTLDVRGGSDATLAEKLSAMCGLDLHLHWLDEQPPVTPAAAHRMALRAAAALDGMASPLALAPLLLAEGHLEQGHRLSGLGGEACRGFYYFGQPRHASTSPHLIGQLANWRLYANEAVDARALEPGFVASARTDALDRITASFDGAPPQWLRATDHFYLYQRMQRWAGAHGSVAAVNRFFINPMFDRRFIQLAHSVSPDQKGSGLLTGQLIHRLDRELAAVPLDSGLVPARLGQPGIRDRAAAARVTARKLSRKVRQRLRHSGRAQLGAAEVAALVVEHWRTEPDVLAPLRNNGIVREAWLAELLAGRRESAPATVAFLTNLLVATAPRPVT
ncbi:hypothetical protein ACFT9M_29735 [Micromonospora purpureochromogenes]|uniref:hypothetical protein n=1 Tax=Micromonospora purpureochromogenes TaxID=47872 RepID=UPI003630122C